MRLTPKSRDVFESSSKEVDDPFRQTMIDTMRPKKEAEDTLRSRRGYVEILSAHRAPGLLLSIG